MKLKKLALSISLVALSFTATAAQEIHVLKENIIRVYDGDTIYVNILGVPDVFGKNIGVRLKGIDTPEMRSKCASADQRDLETAAAKAAKGFVENVIRISKGNHLVLSNVSRDKYFRLLADVYVDDVNLSDRLIEQGYGKAYFGGTKGDWCGSKK